MGDHWQRDTDDLLHELRELEARRRRDYAAALRILAELQVRGVAAEHGYSTLGALLRDLLRVTPREAGRRMNHARLLSGTVTLSGGRLDTALPATADATLDGALDPDHLDVLARTLTDLPPHVPPDAVVEAERAMVAAAVSMDARTLTRVGDRIRAVFDQDGRPPHDPELATPTNELRLSTGPGGRTAFTGELEPEASALLRATLGTLARPRPTTADGPDPRSAAQRNGDALADLIRLAATAPTLPTEAGERPHLLVTIPLADLRSPHADHGPGVGRLEGAGPIDASSARRLACDARIIPAVLGATAEPLDLGRATYAVSTALRRALTLRDAGCAFPGCDRPPGWCHAHHVRHWADGGPTALDNLVLLCGHHHRLVHHSEWTCAVRKGRAEFQPPRFLDPSRVPRHNTAHRPLVRLRR